MDQVGILTGMLLGLVAGLSLGLWIGSGRAIGMATRTSPSPPGHQTDVPADGGRNRPVTRADLEAFELRMEDAYDKLHHLYDRTRKRMRITEPAEPLPGSPADERVLTTKERKARLRQAVAAKRRLGA